VLYIVLAAIGPRATVTIMMMMMMMVMVMMLLMMMMLLIQVMMLMMVMMMMMMMMMMMRMRGDVCDYDIRVLKGVRNKDEGKDDDDNDAREDVLLFNKRS
jgi:hypothetical protein